MLLVRIVLLTREGTRSCVVGDRPRRAVRLRDDPADDEEPLAAPGASRATWWPRGRPVSALVLSRRRRASSRGGRRRDRCPRRAPRAGPCRRPAIARATRLGPSSATAASPSPSPSSHDDRLPVAVVLCRRELRSCPQKPSRAGLALGTMIEANWVVLQRPFALRPVTARRYSPGKVHGADQPDAPCSRQTRTAKGRRWRTAAGRVEQRLRHSARLGLQPSHTQAGRRGQLVRAAAARDRRRGLGSLPRLDGGDPRRVRHGSRHARDARDTGAVPAGALRGDRGVRRRPEARDDVPGGIGRGLVVVRADHRRARSSSTASASTMRFRSSAPRMSPTSRATGSSASRSSHGSCACTRGGSRCRSGSASRSPTGSSRSSRLAESRFGSRRRISARRCAGSRSSRGR